MNYLRATIQQLQPEGNVLQNEKAQTLAAHVWFAKKYIKNRKGGRGGEEEKTEM